MLQTSPIEHLLVFIPPSMHRIAENIWNAGVSHGTKVTDQAHAILDEPEFILTEILRIPVPVNYIPVKNAKDILEATTQKDIHPLYRSKFHYHIKLAEGLINKSASLKRLHSGKY